MSRISYRYLLLISLMLVAVGILLVNSSHARGQQKSRLPEGKWTYTTGPYTGPDYRTIPVDVYSVTSDAKKGLSVTSVGLYNHLPKAVSAVKLHWYLKEQDKLLSDGETPSLGIDIAGGAKESLEYQVISFADLSKNFVNAGRLTADFRVEIAVSEVIYVDESKWSTGQPVDVQSFLDPPTGPGGGCQNQGCVWDGLNSSYICASGHQGSYCSVTQMGNSCTETRCPIGGGGGPQ